jgi:hypothetical protein
VKMNSFQTIAQEKKLPVLGTRFPVLSSQKKLRTRNH